MKKILTIITLACAFCYTTVQAAPIFWGTAEKVIKVADLPDSPSLEVSDPLTGKSKPIDVGYCYKQFQLMFIPIWNYDEHYCGYVSDDTYTDTDKEKLLLAATLLGGDTSWDNDKPKIPMVDRVWGKVGIIVLILIYIIYLVSKRRRED